MNRSPWRVAPVLALAALLGLQAPSAALPLVGGGEGAKGDACAAERAPILERKRQYDALHRSQLIAALGQGVAKGAMFFGGAMLGKLAGGGGGSSPGGFGFDMGALLSPQNLSKAGALQIPGVTLTAGGAPLGGKGDSTTAIAAMAVVVAIAGTVEAYVRLKAAEEGNDRFRMASSIDEDAGRQVAVARAIDGEEQALVACRQRQADDISGRLAGASNDKDRKQLTHDRAQLDGAIKQDVDLTGGVVGQQTQLAKTYTQGRAMTEDQSEADVLAGQKPAYADTASATPLKLPDSVANAKVTQVSTATPAPAPPPPSYATSRSTQVHVAAALKSKVIKTLAADEAVTPKGDPAGQIWAQIDLGNGSVGYVRSADLVKAKAPKLAAPSNIREHNAAVIAARDDGPDRLKSLLTDVQARRGRLLLARAEAFFYLPRAAAGGGPPAAERAVEGAGRRTVHAARPLHHALFAALGLRSPSRRFAGEVQVAG